LDCTSCVVRICLAKSPVEVGCILESSIPNPMEFHCPPCLVKMKRPMEYFILGWALRTVSQSKAVGPLFFVPITLSSFTGYFANMASTMLQEECRDYRPSVSGFHGVGVSTLTHHFEAFHGANPAHSQPEPQKAARETCPSRHYSIWPQGEGFSLH
jgi:hypothetical protein